MSAASTSPSIGLALGAGGARGFAHLVLLEALDQMGLKPAAISGSSMGAVVGAPYAWGLSARELRAHATGIARDKTAALAGAIEARAGGARFWSGPMLIDAERALARFWPAGAPERFEDLAIPFVAAATDFYAREAALFSSGPLRPAVAASMAIPGLVKPVEIAGRAHVDGALVEPLPFECLFAACEVVVACDVVGGPTPGEARAPDRMAALFGATQILQNAVLTEKLKRREPDLLLRPPVDHINAFDFFAAARILRAVDAEREAMKRAIDATLTAALRKNS